MDTCIYTCIHGYMHTWIYAYIHEYMDTCMHAYMDTCIHGYIFSSLTIVFLTFRQIALLFNPLETGDCCHKVHTLFCS